MDIEGQPVIAVDRRGHFSVFGFAGKQGDEYVKCTEAKHAEFVTRFRQKIAASAKASNESSSATAADGQREAQPKESNGK